MAVNWAFKLVSNKGNKNGAAIGGKSDFELSCKDCPDCTNCTGLIWKVLHTRDDDSTEILSINSTTDAKYITSFTDEDKEFTLSITNISYDDGGKYNVTITNKYNETKSRTVTLVVNTITDVKIIPDYVQEGQHTLNCTFKGPKKTNLKWEFENIPGSCTATMVTF